MSNSFTSSSGDALTRAVHAVAAALAELRADPTAESVRHHIAVAEQALAALDRDLTTTVLRRLLESLDACQRAGQSDSGRLADREQSTVRALRMDPRWNPRARPLRNAS
jgi:hypothetical protein